VTKKKIFDLDPGKLYFINKRVKLREKKYFLNLRKNNECSKCTCLLFVVDCFNKKSVVAIISLKRKIDLATKVKKKWWES
jgi:hypothetical protein